ncbi:MAG: radical SAM protein [Candidatus Gracilibacteria bacterium]|nr:radical SAM protein [Candidatus Gracilibacteria bacterium]
MKKILSLKSTEKVINITFNITYKCNFKCYYCFAGELSDKTFEFNIENKTKLYIFIKSIIKNNIDIKIKFLITGGEPILNKDFGELIEFLLGFKSIYVTVTSNIFLLGKIYDKLEIFKNNRFLLIPTFHYFEYQKYDLDTKIFIKNINILQEKNINFDINFLIPTNYSDFTEFKSKYEKIILECNLENNQYHLDLIQEKQVISENYDKYILDYFYYEKLKNHTRKNTLNIIFDDKSSKTYDNKSIIEKGLNDFKGYKCFPFEIPTNLMIDYDLKCVFAGCTTLINQTYDLVEVTKLLNNGKDNYVICNTSNCSCLANIPIKKIYNESTYNRLSKIKNILNDKLRDFLVLDGLDFVEIDVNTNTKSLSISYSSINKNYFLHIMIEQSNPKLNYKKTFNGLGVYTYITNYQGGIINYEISEFDFNQNKIFTKIQKIVPILLKVLRL